MFINIITKYLIIDKSYTLNFWNNKKDTLKQNNIILTSLLLFIIYQINYNISKRFFKKEFDQIFNVHCEK